LEPEVLSAVNLSNISLARQPDFSIVLVCWNNKEYLKPCLESLYEGNLRSRFDVVVVDNGSTDGTQKEAGRIFVEMEKEGLPARLRTQTSGKVLNESDSDHNIFIPSMLINTV